MKRQLKPLLLTNLNGIKMKYDELNPEAKSYAIKNEIKFQIMTEDRPDAIAFNGTIDRLYKEHKEFFEDCCRQDNFNENGVIVKAEPRIKPTF